MRWTVALLAIASTLPYLTLKLLWLSGSRLPEWVPIGLVWTGSAAVAMWSAFFLVTMTVPNDLLGDTAVTWVDQASEPCDVPPGWRLQGSVCT